MKLFVLCALLISSVAAAGTSPTSGNKGGSSPFQVAGREVYQPAVVSPKVRQILQLRALALKLQKEDGGTLSSEHHTMLQAKLDAINATY